MRVARIQRDRDEGVNPLFSIYVSPDASGYHEIFCPNCGVVVQVRVPPDREGWTMLPDPDAECDCGSRLRHRFMQL